jgi:hypothetical protein
VGLVGAGVWVQPGAGKLSNLQEKIYRRWGVVLSGEMLVLLNLRLV